MVCTCTVNTHGRHARVRGELSRVTCVQYGRVQYVVVYSVQDVWLCNVCQSVSMIVVGVCKTMGLTGVPSMTVLLVYSIVVYSMVV